MLAIIEFDYDTRQKLPTLPPEVYSSSVRTSHT